MTVPGENGKRVRWQFGRCSFNLLGAWWPWWRVRFNGWRNDHVRRLCAQGIHPRRYRGDICSWCMARTGGQQ